MLTPLVGGRWRQERLTVKLPQPVGDHGGRGRRPGLGLPDEYPRTRSAPKASPRRRSSVPPAACPHGVAAQARADLAALGGPDGGRLAIIAPDALIPALAEAVPEAIAGDRPSPWTRRPPSSRSPRPRASSSTA